jgi:hypothetical protein
MYSVVAPRELLTVTTRYARWHRTEEGGFGYKISSPAGIFTAELTTLFVTLRRIEEVIQPPGRCLILTDSLSSVKALMFRKITYRTHPLVYECKQMCSDLLEDRIEVEIMWIPAHVGLEGSEIVDGQGEDRKFVSTVSRIMSGHCTARSHLSRFGIVEGVMCVCVSRTMKQWTTCYGTAKDWRPRGAV